MFEQNMSQITSNAQLSNKIDNRDFSNEKTDFNFDICGEISKPKTQPKSYKKTHKHCNRCASLHDYMKVIKSHNESECKWIIKCCDNCKDTLLADYRTHTTSECRFLECNDQYDEYDYYDHPDYMSEDDYPDYDDYDDYYDEDEYDGDSYCDDFCGIVGRWRDTKDGRTILINGINRRDV